MIEAQVQRARLARVSEAEAKICSERSRAKRRRTHDHPDQPRKATREAMTDVEIIAQILQALGEGPRWYRSRRRLLARQATERRRRMARRLTPPIPPHRYIL